MLTFSKLRQKSQALEFGMDWEAMWRIPIFCYLDIKTDRRFMVGIEWAPAMIHCFAQAPE